MAQCLLTIDQGTTTSRAVLYDLEGRIVSQAYREVYPYHPQPGWAEADPQEWWQATVAVVREALDQSAGSPSDVAGIGISALQHAIVPVDRDGNPLARAMLWMDQRCAPQVEWMIRHRSAAFIQGFLSSARGARRTRTALAFSSSLRLFCQARDRRSAPIQPAATRTNAPSAASPMRSRFSTKVTRVSRGMKETGPRRPVSFFSDRA